MCILSLPVHANLNPFQRWDTSAAAQVSAVESLELEAAECETDSETVRAELVSCSAIAETSLHERF